MTQAYPGAHHACVGGEADADPLVLLHVLGADGESDGVGVVVVFPGEVQTTILGLTSSLHALIVVVIILIGCIKGISQ